MMGYSLPSPPKVPNSRPPLNSANEGVGSLAANASMEPAIRASGIMLGLRSTKTTSSSEMLFEARLASSPPKVEVPFFTAILFPLRSSRRCSGEASRTMMRCRCSPVLWLAMIFSRAFCAQAIMAVVSPMVPISAEPEYKASAQAGPLLKRRGCMTIPDFSKKLFLTATIGMALPTRF